MIYFFSIWVGTFFAFIIQTSVGSWQGHQHFKLPDHSVLCRRSALQVCRPFPLTAVLQSSSQMWSWAVGISNRDSCSFRNNKRQPLTDRSLRERAKWEAGGVCPCLVAAVKSHSMCQRNVIHLPQRRGFKAAPTMETLFLKVKRGERFPLPSSQFVMIYSLQDFHCQELLNRSFKPKNTGYHDHRDLIWFNSLQKQRVGLKQTDNIPGILESTLTALLNHAEIIGTAW